MGLVLQQEGVDREALLRRASLPPDTFSPPRQRLSVSQYFDLWQAVDDASPDPTLGVRLAARYPDNLLEPALLICHGSRDLGQALDRLSRYKRTLCPERLHLSRPGGRVSLHYEWSHSQRRPPPALIEAEYAFLIALARKATQRPLGRVEITLTRQGGDAQAFALLLGAEVELGAEEGRLSLEAKALELPFLTHSPGLVEALEPPLEAALERGLGNVALSLRQALVERRGSGEISVTLVARDLGMSRRTLQRRLREEGTSFARELTRVRRERAQHCLRGSDLSLPEIAFVLGFDRANSFSRAFSEWTGHSPSAYRELASS